MLKSSAVMTTPTPRDQSGVAGSFDDDALKQRVEDFWNSKTCGSDTSRAPRGSREYFDEIEAYRYRVEPHIPELAEFSRWTGKDVLEIGVGMGTDALQFARHGARLTGVDLTPAAIDNATARFALYGVNGTFQVADAEALPFPDRSFDLVYSYGVLHHTPNTRKAVEHVHRVLRPGGEARVMLYHRDSYRYWFEMMLGRRAAFHLLRFGMTPRTLSRISGYPLTSVERMAEVIRRSPRIDAKLVLDQSTDGPGNPLSKVYSRGQARELFSAFSSVRTYTRYLVKQNIPVIGRHLPDALDRWLGARVGAALFIVATK